MLSFGQSQVDLDSWYRSYAESVHRRVLRLCRDPEWAWDMTQDVFVRAHRYRSSFRGDSKPLTWLFKVADRTFFDAVKKRRFEVDIDFASLEQFLSSERTDNEDVFEDHEIVRRLLARAPKDVQAILVHRYFDELELEEIASLLNMNEKTVRRKLLRFFEQARKFARRTAI